jgi:hypothetical protein
VQPRLYSKPERRDEVLFGHSRTLYWTHEMSLIGAWVQRRGLGIQQLLAELVGLGIEVLALGRSPSLV